MYRGEWETVHVHDICIVDSGDFKRILRATNYGKMALFHNKYFMEYDHRRKVDS